MKEKNLKLSTFVQNKKMATKEQIKIFRAMQEMQAMLEMSKIRQEKREELTRMAQELMATNSKTEILMVLRARENLNPQEERALEAILLMMHPWSHEHI